MPADGENATPPSTSGTSTTKFSCNVSLPPKIEVRCENLFKEWKHWRQVWDAYEEVTELRNKTSLFRVATFITCNRKEALEVHKGRHIQRLELWANHWIGKTNIIYERYKFNTFAGTGKINRHLHHYTLSARRNLRAWNLER